MDNKSVAPARNVFNIAASTLAETLIVVPERRPTCPALRTAVQQAEHDGQRPLVARALVFPDTPEELSLAEANAILLEPSPVADFTREVMLSNWTTDVLDIDETVPEMQQSTDVTTVATTTIAAAEFTQLQRAPSVNLLHVFNSSVLRMEQHTAATLFALDYSRL